MNNENLGIPADASTRRFTGIWIPAEIWEDNQLPALAKLLYAEIASFGDRGCWKRSDELREPLGISSETFQKLCRRLREGGYITEHRSFGRVVRTTTLGFRSSSGIAHQQEIPGVHQADSPCDEQAESPGVHIEYSNNKVRSYKRDESVADDEIQEFGRADINAFVEAWSDEIYDIRGDKSQRRQAYNLIRKYGSEGAESLLERVSAMRRQNDRFAPNIAKPSDLTGKYSKLDKLEAWEARNAKEEFKLPGYLKLAYMEPSAQEEPSEGPSDEERAAVLEQFKEARKTLPFLGGNKK